MTRHASVSAMGLTVLALLAALTASLSAHMEAVRTLPADASSMSSVPAQVRVWFTQQPSPRISLLRMTGPGGDVELGEVTIDRQDRSIAAAVPGTLAPGRYEVSWRTAGDDGHVMRDTFAFVLEPAE